MKKNRKMQDIVKFRGYKLEKIFENKDYSLYFGGSNIINRGFGLEIT